MKTKEEIFRTAYVKLRMKGLVEGPADMNKIKAHYNWRRRVAKDGVKPSLARALINKAGPGVHFEPSLGKADDNGHRCVVNPGAYGLRFVDYSDEIIGGMNSHEGWFTSRCDYSEETYRGCVFQLPGREGKSLLLAGYYDKEAGHYIVDFSGIYPSIPKDHPTEFDNELGLVAKVGDRMAERDAEECREHDYKWQQANRWQELIDSVTDTGCECESARTERDRLREEIKEIEGDFPDIEQFAREYL